MADPTAEQSAELTVTHMEGRVIGEKLAGMHSALMEGDMDPEWAWHLLADTARYLWIGGDPPECCEEYE